MKNKLDKDLFSSCFRGDLDKVKELIQQGADINCDDGYPLQIASRDGYFDIVKYLVELGADIHSTNDLAFTWAADYYHLNIFKYLYRHRKQKINLNQYCLTPEFKKILLNLGNNKVYDLL